MSLSLSSDLVLAAAVAEADSLRLPVAIAVVDAGGHAVVVVRGDGATFLNTRLALDKARTAAGMGVPTAAMIEDLAQAPIPVVAGLTGRSGVTPVPGGEPLRHDGLVFGAIGVSGPDANDVPVAVAGAQALPA